MEPPELSIERTVKIIADQILENERKAGIFIRQEKRQEISTIFNVNFIHSISDSQTAGLSWILVSKWVVFENCEWLAMSVSCNEFNISNLWSCDTEIHIKIIKSEREVFSLDVFRTTFRVNKPKLCFLIMKKEEVFNNIQRLAKDSEIQLSTTINVISTFGIRNENISDFLQPNNSDSEVCLRVGDSRMDSRMFVDKHVLMAFSPFLRTLLRSGNNLNEILIHDFGYEEMKCFLNVLNQGSQPINENNVAFMLKLADYFGVNFIMNKCEEFLINSTISARLKLEFAEQYHFSLLQRKTLESINSMDEMREMYRDISEMSEKTATALLKRIFSANNPLFEAEQKLRRDNMHIVRTHDPR